MLPPNRLLELSLTDGQFARGVAVQVLNDTLYLRPDNGGLVPLSRYPLADILRVRQWHTNSSTGAGWGATSGAIVVGGFGVLVGLLVVSYDHQADSDEYIAPVLALTLVGAAAGAFTGGVLGAGVGALVSSWHQVWPALDSSPGVIAATEFPPYSRNTRLNLFAGGGHTVVPSYDVTSFVGRVSVHKTLSEKVSLGPSLGYHNFGGDETLYGNGYTEIRSRDDLLMMALTAKFRGDQSGIGPYGTVGTGWFIGDKAFIGGHLGGGLRWPVGGTTDLELDVRYHFNFTHVDPDQIDQFWTVGLNFGFGI
jgi:hypothetical protein